MNSPNGRVWAFDFDGTISPLVPDRDAAALDPACRTLLSELAGDRRQVVAVLSSRSLDDLACRIDIDDVILSGSSGLEWALPGGHRLGPNAHAVERLERERKHLIPSLGRLVHIPGVELEDKVWSTAVHFRRADADARRRIERELGRLGGSLGVTVYYGPDVAEVQFLAKVSKEIAIKMLARLNRARYVPGNMLYAGDDQNDAQAMKWVMAQKGTVYVVGGRISIAGAHGVGTPADLASAIRRDHWHRAAETLHREGRYE